MICEFDFEILAYHSYMHRHDTAIALIHLIGAQPKNINQV